MNNFKILLCSFLCLGLTLVFSSTDTVAQEDKSSLLKTPKFYVGLGAGLTSIDTGLSATTGTAKLDEDDIGFKGFIGFQPHKNIAIEAFYIDFGEASLTGNNGDTFVANGTTYTFIANNVKVGIAASTVGASLVGFIPLHEMVSPIVKIGFHAWESDLSATSSAGGVTLADDGQDIFFGLGGQINFNQNIALRAMVERFKFDDEYVDYFSSSFVVKF
jgi:OOP family OmpA-OmpF porin